MLLDLRLLPQTNMNHHNLSLLLLGAFPSSIGGSSMSKSKDSGLVLYRKVDRISQLPDNVINTILIKLPVADAARTAVLSSRWKERWKNISHLSFDLSYSPLLKRSISAIHNILLLHTGPIVGIKLAIDSASSFEIDPVLRCLSTKLVQDLEIFLNSQLCILPSSLYSCHQLRSLKLSTCKISPPCNFGGFDELIRLRLFDVEVANNLFENFISNCPLLEELYMVTVQLKEFSTIKINAPNLKRFYFEGFGLCFRFMSAPLLKELTCLEGEDESPDTITIYSEFEGFKKSYLDEFCNALPALESFRVDSSFLQTLEVQGISSKSTRCLKYLHQLKVLTVCYIRFWDADDVTSLLGLIGSSPNLEKLSILGGKCRSSDEIDNPFESLGSDLCNFSCEKLRVVSVSFMGDHDSDLDFVKLLLSKSPQLKTMTVSPCKRPNSEKHLNMLKTVTQFKRASTAAEIIIGKLG